MSALSRALYAIAALLGRLARALERREEAV